MLEAPVEIACTSEQALTASLRPGVDGLILAEGKRRGTLLPQVWREDMSREHFVGIVKRKAGLAEDYWSDTMRAWRYGAESFAEPVAEIDSRGAR